MTPEHASQKRVLVVEDDLDFAALLQSILAGAGYAVTVAYSCEEAMDQARKARPDLITLDIQMSRKSGVFFYRKLKEDARFRDIPVVVVTGLSRENPEMETILRTVLQPGGMPPPDAYLEKPVDRSDLLKAVESALAGGSSTSR